MVSSGDRRFNLPALTESIYCDYTVRVVQLSHRKVVTGSWSHRKELGRGKLLSQWHKFFIFSSEINNYLLSILGASNVSTHPREVLWSIIPVWTTCEDIGQSRNLTIPCCCYQEEWSQEVSEPDTVFKICPKESEQQPGSLCPQQRCAPEPFNKKSAKGKVVPGEEKRLEVSCSVRAFKITWDETRKNKSPSCFLEMEGSERTLKIKGMHEMRTGTEMQRNQQRRQKSGWI